MSHANYRWHVAISTLISRHLYNHNLITQSLYFKQGLVHLPGVETFTKNVAYIPKQIRHSKSQIGMLADNGIR